MRVVFSTAACVVDALASGAPLHPLIGWGHAVSEKAKGATFGFEPADKVVWRLPVGTFSLATGSTRPSRPGRSTSSVSPRAR
jgi:hypothetical protein